MKKKFFAVALATTMALSTVMTASAATADVDITGGLGSANTGDEAVTGNFDVTYTFHNASQDTSQNWFNFAIELYEGANFITMRADAFGWGSGDYQSVLDGATTWTGQPADWAVWAAGMADADVTVNVKRSGNVLTFTYDINAGGTDYHFVGVTPEIPNLAETLNIHLTGEKVKLTNVKFTVNTSDAGGEDPTTGTGGEEPTTGAEEEETSIIGDLDIPGGLGTACTENKVVTGDFNAVPSDDPIQVLTNESDERHLTHARNMAEFVYGPEWTFHGFGRVPLKKRGWIDYIFVKGEFRVLKYAVLTETLNHLYPSDHCPLLSTMIIE